MLPIKTKPKLYIESIGTELTLEFADIVDTPEEADLALLRLKAPYQARKGNPLEMAFDQVILDLETDGGYPPSFNKSSLPIRSWAF